MYPPIYIKLIYPIGLYAFQSVIFATIYSNSSYFISGFCAGNIYLSCIVSISCIVIISCIVLLFILKHFILDFCTYIYTIFFFSILCTV